MKRYKKTVQNLFLSSKLRYKITQAYKIKTWNQAKQFQKKQTNKAAEIISVNHCFKKKKNKQTNKSCTVTVSKTIHKYSTQKKKEKLAQDLDLDLNS
jgi:hypothetical protein